MLLRFIFHPYENLVDVSVEIFSRLVFLRDDGINTPFQASVEITVCQFVNRFGVVDFLVDPNAEMLNSRKVQANRFIFRRVGIFCDFFHLGRCVRVDVVKRLLLQAVILRSGMALYLRSRDAGISRFSGYSVFQAYNARHRKDRAPDRS